MNGQLTIRAEAIPGGARCYPSIDMTDVSGVDRVVLLMELYQLLDIEPKDYLIFATAAQVAASHEDEWRDRHEG